MTNKSLLLASALAITILASCSKSLVLTDGEKTKKIWVDGKIEMKKDINNNTVVSFQSIEGTKYTIDANKYSYVIK
ncbi:MAG: hypothetical protein ACKVOU_09675 [Cytophagales bacterium]